MTYLCTAPQTVIHTWTTAEPDRGSAPELRDCPDHDGQPTSFSEPHLEQQEKAR